jgi:redox-sensitive bicupin YhaK (pirin superfamily)
VIETRTPILYLDVHLAPGARFSPAVPRGYNGFVYVVDGEVSVGSERRRVNRGELAVLTTEGDDVSFQAPLETAARLLLVGGAPIGEPVARYGPFVMNTRREILEAIEDLQRGRFVASSVGALRS